MTSHPDNLGPETEKLAAEFEHLADESAGQPSAVDFGLALAAGRRSVRNRRALAGASGVTALGLAALVAVPALLPGPAVEPVTVSPAPVSTSPLDPLVAEARFGWLPAGLTATSENSNPLAGFGIVVAYNPKEISDSGLNTSAALYTWPSNGSSPLSHTSVPGQAVTDTKIGTLNGAPVDEYVTTENGGLDGNSVNGGWLAPPKCETFSTPGISLSQAGITAYGLVSVQWRTPSGDWADIEYNYVNQTAPDAAELLHMAKTATFDETSLKMPFQVTGLGRVSVAGAEQGQYRAVSPDYNLLQFQQDNVIINIAVDSPASTVLQCGQRPKNPDLFATRKINGLEFTVYLEPLAPGASNANAGLTKFGTAPEILDHITSYGPNPANWTTRVILP